MFLKRLVLNNIRSIESLDLSFGTGNKKLRQWTLILGENGSGKSTLLKALALALVGAEGLQDLLGEPSDWVRIGSAGGFIKVEILEPSGATLEVELFFTPQDTPQTFLTRNAAALDRLAGAQQHASHRFLTVGYGVSRRLPGAKASLSPRGAGFSGPGAQCLATLFDPQAALYPLDVWAGDLHTRRGAAGIEFLKTAFQDVLPGVELSEFNLQKRELLFNTPDGVLPLRRLGEGYQNIITWWGDLLARITDALPGLKNLLSAHGILLIDEIESHLHPLWQRQLRDILIQKLPNFQIVATTYSPFTAQQCAEGELFYLRRAEEKASSSLVAFAGDPRRLKIQQLIASPLFGLDTVASKYVEELRKSYQDLRAGEMLGLVDDTQLQQVTKELAEIADDSRVGERERKQQELLAEIKRALEQ